MRGSQSGAAQKRMVKQGVAAQAAMRGNDRWSSGTDGIWEWGGGENDLLALRF